MSKSLLSIQSHVSHGYVGGKSATFPLQTQGWEVDNINTVSFSNHTGYGQFKGPVLDENDLKSILQGLDNLQLTYNAILTGYIPNAKLISVVNDYIKKAKLHQPKLLYLLDPVMGDEGHLYVDSSCITEYRKILEDQVVDIITPNQFELELICDTKIESIQDLKDCINFLHSKFGIKYVVISSLNLNLKLTEDCLNEKFIYCAISTSDYHDFQLFKIPIIRSYFTGIGDLFSALLLSKLYHNLKSSKTQHSFNVLSRTVNQVLTIMRSTLQLTHKLGVEEYCKTKGLTFKEDIEIQGKINDADTMKFFELKIIQSKEYFTYDGEGNFIPEPV